MSLLDIPAQVSKLSDLGKLTRLDVSERLPALLTTPYRYGSGTYTVRSDYDLTGAGSNLILTPPYYSRYWYNTPNYTWYQYCWIGSSTASENFARPWRDVSKKAMAFVASLRTNLLAQRDAGERSTTDLDNFRLVFNYAGAVLRENAVGSATSGVSANDVKHGQICLEVPRQQSCNPAAFDLLPLDLGYPTSSQNSSCYSDGYGTSTKGACACLLGLN